MLTLLATPAAPSTMVLSLWLERGGNLESLGNERVIVRYDGELVYERGKPFQRKDPKYGTVIDGTCERFQWKLTAAELEALRAVAARADVGSLAPNYRDEGVEDGSQGAIMADMGDRVVVSRFDNEFPPAYRMLWEHLTTNVLAKPEQHGRPTRCDVASWFFIRPPNDSRR